MAIFSEADEERTLELRHKQKERYTQNLFEKFREEDLADRGEMQEITNYFLRKDNQKAIKLIVDCLLKRHNFKAILFGTKPVLYRYAEGIYKANGRFYAEQVLEKYLSKHMSNRTVSEVISHIERITYISINQLNIPNDSICLENGILSLRTGELRPHTYTKVFLTKLPVTYDPKADCPQFKKFLSEINPEKIRMLEEIVGFVLSPTYFLQKFIILTGEGSNGKSVYLSTIRALLGDKNVSAVSLQDLDQNRFARAKLFGKMANICPDISDRELSNTAIIKALTGQDLISAEEKFKDQFTFVNTAKMLFSANKIPKTYDTSNAFYRRPVIINFPNVFEGANKDPELLSKLTTNNELSGLLNIAIQRYQELKQSGSFTGEMSTEEVRKQYTKLSDSVGSFILECLDVDPDEYEKKADIYQAYKQYCLSEELIPDPDNSFWRSLRRQVEVRDRRITANKITKDRVQVVFGVKLREDFRVGVKVIDENVKDSVKVPKRDVKDTKVSPLLVMSKSKITIKKRENFDNPDNPDTKQMIVKYIREKSPDDSVLDKFDPILLNEMAYNGDIVRKPDGKWEVV